MKYPLAAEVEARDLARLLRSYVIETDGCWRWTRARTTSGYGHFHWSGAYYQAHRFVYTIFRGPVTTPVMDHLCRNRWCVNPDHVEPVSHAVNVQRGATAVLTAELAAEIRASYRRYDRKASCRALARKYGVDHSTISRVLTGRLWPATTTEQEEAA